MQPDNTYEQTGLPELSQRVAAVEAAVRQLSSLLEDLQRSVDSELSVRTMNPPLDRVTSQFSRLEGFIIAKFPQYAHETQSAVDMPGVTGDSEMGPGNKPMPRVYVGGNATRDPHDRVIG